MTELQMLQKMYQDLEGAYANGVKEHNEMRELLQRAADKLQDYAAENSDANDSLAVEIQKYLEDV